MSEIQFKAHLVLARNRARILSILSLLLTFIVTVFGGCETIPVKSLNYPQMKTGYKCSDHKLSTFQQIWTELRHILEKDKNPTDPIYLKLSYLNKMDRLYSGWFDMNVPLRVLDFQRIENLHSMEKDSFNSPQFETLEKLIIQYAPIKVLKTGAFNGLTNLKLLELLNLNVNDVEENILFPVPNLVDFHIMNCKSDGMRINHFFGSIEMNHLTNINIQNCQFKDTITELTFSKLHNLMHLRLLGNRIEQIHVKAFDVPLQSLITLDLSRNKLQTLPKDIFKSIVGNKQISINLFHNEWRCDSGFGETVNFLKSCQNVQLRVGQFECTCAMNETLMTKNEISISNPSISISNSTLINEFDPIEGIECNKSKTNLLKFPSKEEVLAIHVEYDKLYINLNVFKSDIELIVLRKDDEGTLKCLVDFQSDNATPFERFQNIHSQRTTQVGLKSHQNYQFCFVEKRINMAVPLNCISFLWNIKEDPEIWLLIEHKFILLITCVLGGVLVPAFGIGISFFLAKLFPAEIRGRRQHFSKKPVLLTLKATIKPIRPTASLKKLRKFSINNFDEYETTGYITSADIPPPLPPRKMLENEMEIKCCDNEYCQCYCEM